MKKQDYILIIVLYGSLLAGVCKPDVSAEVSGYIKYCMMTVLFLSFIKISPYDLGQAMRKNWAGIAWGTLIRLCITPALAYGITQIIYPPLAVPILLLAGTSTGVSAPFFTSLCQGNTSYCLVMAVLTSLILPLSLPLMVQALSHSALNYDLYSMARFLAMVIFIPLGLAFLFRFFMKKALVLVNKVTYPLSLLMIAAINFGALGRYVPEMQAAPKQVLYCLGFSFALALIQALLGWHVTRSPRWPDKIAASGSQIWINNILIIALAVHIQQPLAAILGAFYMIPFCGFVVFFSMQASKHQQAARP